MTLGRDISRDLISAPKAAQIRIWHYPETTRPPIVVDTRHQANLFGVRFLPCTNNLQLVSGAMDYTVQVTRKSSRSSLQAHTAEMHRRVRQNVCIAGIGAASRSYAADLLLSDGLICRVAHLR